MNEKISGKTHLHHSIINMEQLKNFNMIVIWLTNQD